VNSKRQRQPADASTNHYDVHKPFSGFQVVIFGAMRIDSSQSLL
jgi:hypothetical protein